MEHQDSLPITVQTPAQRREQEQNPSNQERNNQDQQNVVLTNDIENPTTERVKEPVKGVMFQQNNNIGLSNQGNNEQLFSRERRRMDPNGGQRPCFCFYEDNDQEFRQEIGSNTQKQVDGKQQSTKDLYYVENEQHYGYHYFGYYYGPICPCFQMCDCCKNIVAKNTERLGMLSGGGGSDSTMCCFGLFDRADTCCKMFVDAWFYLICLPFRIIVETYKSIFRVCCGGESVGGSLAQATCFDSCCQSIFNAFSQCYGCFSDVCGQACAPVCGGLNQCLGTACMQSMIACGGVAFKAVIQFLSIPLQGLILVCTQLCQQIIVPCCECLVRNADICCEIFRCLG